MKIDRRWHNPPPVNTAMERRAHLDHAALEKPSLRFGWSKCIQIMTTAWTLLPLRSWFEPVFSRLHLVLGVRVRRTGATTFELSFWPQPGFKALLNIISDRRDKRGDYDQVQVLFDLSDGVERNTRASRAVHFDGVGDLNDRNAVPVLQRQVNFHHQISAGHRERMVGLGRGYFAFHNGIISRRAFAHNGRSNSPCLNRLVHL